MGSRPGSIERELLHVHVMVHGVGWERGMGSVVRGQGSAEQRCAVSLCN